MRVSQGLAPIGPRLREWRISRGLAQAAAARLVSARPNDWARWERGVTAPGLGWRARLEALLAGEGGERSVSVPEQLREYRRVHALTQTEAAQRMGVSVWTWASWEEGRRTPGARLRGRIWRFLDRELAPFRQTAREAA